MAIDLAALKAKLAAQKAAAPQITKVETPNAEVKTTPGIPANIHTSNNGNVGTNAESISAVDIPTVNPPATLGTSKTSEIDHLDFIAKMNSLSEAIHKQHPLMPTLLMQIHKQLRADPELVTTLDDAAIGIVVKGLQVQTKTELVSEAVKKTGGRTKKNPALDVSML